MALNSLKLCHSPRFSKMVQDGLKLYKAVFQDGLRFRNGKRCLKHRKKYILHMYGQSAEGAKAGGKKRKRSTILPISIVQSFFYVIFFSLVLYYISGWCSTGADAQSRPGEIVEFSNFGFFPYSKVNWSDEGWPHIGTPSVQPTPAPESILM